MYEQPMSIGGGGGGGQELDVAPLDLLVIEFRLKKRTASCCVFCKVTYEWNQFISDLMVLVLT